MRNQPVFTQVVNRLARMSSDHILARIKKRTSGHPERVALQAAQLYFALGRSDKKDLTSLLIAALAHDVGKNGISEEILLKPGKLSLAEFEDIKTHTDKTKWILAKLMRDAEKLAFIASSHHERWDGCGYPRGLQERSIPFLSRIITVADVWDALIEDRIYHNAFSPEECLVIMQRERGKIFDPHILDRFLASRSSLLLPEHTF
jgi:HD-GYP domain-containing protein (c-di-GMP phosphodiesterase class II)